MAEITITDFHDARECYRNKQLRQALYDAGEVVMGDVLVNLHGDAHRDRRRLENRLFRRETFELYERDLFPPIIADTLASDVAAGRTELVGELDQAGPAAQIPCPPRRDHLNFRVQRISR